MSSANLYLNDSEWAGGLTRSERFAARPSLERLLSTGFGAVVVSMDLLLVMSAFLMAHWVRFILPDEAETAVALPLYSQMGLAIAALTVGIMAFQGLYDHESSRTWLSRVNSIFTATSMGFVLALFGSYMANVPSFSRLWLVAGWAISVLALVAWRSGVTVLHKTMRDTILPPKRVLIVGANSQGERAARELAGNREIIGFVDNGSRRVHSDIPLVGTVAQIERLVQLHQVDEVIVALPSRQRSQVNRIIARGFDRHVAVHMLADIRDLVMPRQVRLDELGGRAYVGFDLTPKVSWLKRWMDVLGSIVALLLLSPIMISVAVLIKLESEGPIFYRATRVGKDGKTFGMIKFRSMRRDADKLLASLMASNEADGPIFKMKSDPRITKVGAVIRRLSIDELPQIFNVLMGDMSLVGPRPPIPTEVEKYDDWHHGRLRAVPGMTGLWQVSGRSSTTFQEMVRLDMRYIRNWSVGLDLEIIWRTIPAVLKSRGAY